MIDSGLLKQIPLNFEPVSTIKVAQMGLSVDLELVVPPLPGLGDHELHQCVTVTGSPVGPADGDALQLGEVFLEANAARSKRLPVELAEYVKCALLVLVHLDDVRDILFLDEHDPPDDERFDPILECFG